MPHYFFRLCFAACALGAVPALAQSADSGASAGGSPHAASQVPANQLIRQVLTAKDTASRARLLKSLRQLKDPALTPLFAQMASSTTPQLRAEGILGLAEIEAAKSAGKDGARPPAGIDLLPVRRLEPLTQVYVLSQAIDRNLLPSNQLEDLARWPDLQAGIYVSVAGRLVADGKRLDPTRLRQIASDAGDPIVSTIASMLLVQQGSKDAATAAAATGERLLASKAKGVPDAARRILSVIRERKLASGAPFARRCIELQGSDRLLRFEAVGTLLVVESAGDRAATLFAAEWKSASDLAERTRLALAAAAAAMQRSDGLPGSVVTTLRQDADPLIASVGEAVEAALTRSNVVPAFTALVTKRSAPVLGWVMAACERLSPDEARAVRLALVSAAIESNDRAIEMCASEAATALAESDPDVLVAPLTTALQKRDDRTAGRIVAAALRSNNPAAAPLARVGRSLIEKDREGPLWTSASVGAIADVLYARHATSLTPEQIDTLANIATGSGALPESTRVQAAWIALKASSGVNAALSRLVADLAQ